uniref:Uncharacterized protein n=1 Tax=viral metagenome TaxID=1070528 RepID=A0A6C0I700_9ZZZZ
MNSDNETYMIDDDGQIVLLPNTSTPQQGVVSPQQGFVSPQQGVVSPQQGFVSPQQGVVSPQQGFVSPQQGFVSPQQGFVSPQQLTYSSNLSDFSQLHPTVAQTQPNTQNINRPRNTVYKQLPYRPIQQQQPQQSLLKPIQPQMSMLQPQRQIQTQTPTHAPNMQSRTLNSHQPQNDVSYNNWKKMNLNITQMVTENTQSQPQSQYNDEPVMDIQPHLQLANRARYGSYIDNSQRPKTYSVRTSNGPSSCLSIKKANNKESIYM